MLTARATTPELMDDAALAPDVYARVLNDLARVNTWTRARPPTLDWLARASAGLDDYSLIDIGFGQGDMLRAVARAAARRGQRARLTGYDLNPKSAAVARAAAGSLDIDFVTGDARAGERPDFIISSLVAHHMGDGELVAFLRWMDGTARRGWLINDLHRHWVAHRGYQLLSAVMGVHEIVRHDGALSVRRAFTRAEWGRLLAAAGVKARVRWHVPFRFTVSSL
ncbi:MAG: methyltransferase domain-containing protein [Polymorphobacter sp.]|uniref:methyltransferase domain-containing protein n=1 Tax=Polymorphobacter sp. TaxID=1909290 RepID=UPI003A864EBB